MALGIFITIHVSVYLRMTSRKVIKGNSILGKEEQQEVVFFFTKLDRRNDFIFKQNYFLNFYGTQEQIK